MLFSVVKFFLLLVRPIERFLAQLIWVSTAPFAFVRERVRLGDTTNFLRAFGFFVSAISTAFLAEVATLNLLGISGLSEPYYWLFVLLTSIPFVLICFLLVRFVAPLSFKDVLHLSFYPIGAGVLTGAAFALAASMTVAALVAYGYISDIKIDYTQWLEGELGVAAFERALHDCLRERSFVYTVLSSGLQAAYEDLKPPIDELSYLRPVITVLYLGIAASFFVAAVDRRKLAVFAIVLVAASLATGANVAALKAYFEWNYDPSCEKEMVERTVERSAESILKRFVLELGTSQKEDPFWDLSAQAEGRTLLFTYRFKGPIDDLGAFYRASSLQQKHILEGYCSDKIPESRVLRDMKATQTHTYYSFEGERLTSFSIGPADCPQW